MRIKRTAEISSLNIKEHNSLLPHTGDKSPHNSGNFRFTQNNYCTRLTSMTRTRVVIWQHNTYICQANPLSQQRINAECNAKRIIRWSRSAMCNNFCTNLQISVSTQIYSLRHAATLADFLEHTRSLQLLLEHLTRNASVQHNKTPHLRNSLCCLHCTQARWHTRVSTAHPHI